MKSAEIRQSFLDYFASKGHQIVESSSLVPDNDATLLFTNSGMVQFKDAFAFRENRGYTRAASCQRCVRAGGKHNDLDNVGYTARHHTFFEMLGNFSFGDYFKREAIGFAWEYLTQVLKIPPERLWVTVHNDDDEAADIWVNEIGFDAARVTRMGDEANFWTMGDTGPCGPSSEIYYDHGPGVPGGPPGTPEGDLDRFVEVWNLVFTQFDRSADGTLTPLPRKCVDTGMGLERLAAVMQHVHNNYHIDLFRNLVVRTAEYLGCRDQEDASLKVIADHIRSSAFLIADGVMPSNEGRGYVLRRIIRRALRHGHKLQARSPFFHRLVEQLASDMGGAYPILDQTRQQIARVLLREEQQFEVTLDQGMRILYHDIVSLKDTEVPGDLVFKLYDTYGFPVDLTADIAREKGLTLDLAGFNAAMEAQRQRARAASKFVAEGGADIDIDSQTEFTGYDQLTDQTVVVALLVDGQPVERMPEGTTGVLVVDRSPFYAESGGQVGDTGVFESATARFEVSDTRKQGSTWLHHGRLARGQLAPGDRLEARVDEQARQATVLNHSATHLMHAALRQVLGTHVQQRGSLVGPQRLRFDFSHFEPMTGEEIRKVERIVNQQIRGNSPVQTEILDINAARQKGAMALFGEKYSEKVRVLTMGDGYSIELCGGTHANRTGDIGIFRILSEQGIASGVRRIEAVTGELALQWIEQTEDVVATTLALVKADRPGLQSRVKSVLEQNRRLEKEVLSLKQKLLTQPASSSADEAIEVRGVKLMVKQVDGSEPKALPGMMDQLKARLGSGVVLLAGIQGDSVSLIAGVTKDLTERISAGDLVNHVARQIGGKGGGRADMARGGGNQPAGLPAALESVAIWLSERL